MFISQIQHAGVCGGENAGLGESHYFYQEEDIIVLHHQHRQHGLQGEKELHYFIKST